MMLSLKILLLKRNFQTLLPYIPFVNLSHFIYIYKEKFLNMTNSKSVKIVLAGDAGVGKSTLISTKKKGKFDCTSKITLGVDFNVVNFANSEYPQLLVFDLGGQSRFQFLHDSYIRGASAAIILYDLTRERSFENLSKWFKMLKKECGDIPVIVAGTKMDLCQPEDMMYYKTKWKKFFALEKDGLCRSVLNHMIISSKEYMGVDEIFMKIAQKITQNQKNPLECKIG